MLLAKLYLDYHIIFVIFFAISQNQKRILGLTLFATYSYFVSAVLLLSGFAPLHPLLLLNLLLQEIEPPFNPKPEVLHK